MARKKTSLKVGELRQVAADTFADFIEEGMLVHPESVELRNELIMRKGMGSP